MIDVYNHCKPNYYYGYARNDNKGTPKSLNKKHLFINLFLIDKTQV